MSISSLTFPIFALLAVMAFRVLRPGLAKDAAISLFNLVLLLSFCGTISEMIPLLLFLSSGYVAILAASRYRGNSIVGLTIILVLIFFIFLKQYSIVSFIPKLDFIYLTVGLSYILFRILHLVIDVSQGAARVPSLLSFFNYTTFFLTFVSGPIQKYAYYCEQINSSPMPMTNNTLQQGIARALSGYLLLFALVTPLARVSAALQIIYYSFHYGHDFLMTSALHAVTAAAYMIYLYLNFVAYMNIVIGIGYLAGIILPENFNFPLGAANFLDLWNRWHITLSQWFKTYLFYPFLTFLARRFGGRISVNYLGAAAFFVTFGVMGLWHGTTSIFILYGLALGLGATINKLWQVAFVDARGKKAYQTLCSRGWYKHFARSITLAYFAMALTCLWIDPARTAVYGDRFTWSTIFAAFALLMFSGMFISAAGQYLFDIGRRICTAFTAADNVSIERLTRARHYISWPVQSAVFTCVVLILALVVSGRVPQIVYQGF